MTVREIAELAGVSIGTVDRVLYKRGRVSAVTKAKIETIIERYQFTPNPIARRLKRNRAYHFCALLPQRDQDAGYWSQILTGIEEAATEIAPLGVEMEIIEFDRYSQEKFQAAAAAILEKKPDGLIFSPIMPGRISSFIEGIRQIGIPCIFIDAKLPGADPLCTIGQDSFRGGYLAGRLMHLFAGKITKPVAILDLHGEDYHIVQRRDGFLRYAGEQGFPSLVQEYSSYLGTEISVEEISRFLRENPDLTGIFVTNSMAHRVAQAAKERKKPRDFLLIGYDLVPNNRLFLEEGWIDVIISQRPESQGREALLNLYRRIVLEQQIPQKVEIPLDMYLKENIPV
ncbi:LacI family DNA-binding transcriptional regulator [Treponema primitia]|uniref:LacI family DNA-binding transcriptional regulator n=1 Tax=Treponema primitia TaxID=88058 RepID=UPI0002554FDD|nr:LacI family DNA-binding transcriptional regulator [Treponema primitia]